MSTWALAAGQWRSTPSHALTTATARKLTFRLDAPCQLTFHLDGRGVDAGAIDVLETDVWVYLNGSLLYRGRVVAAPDTLDGTQHSREVTVTDYRGLLSRRYAMAPLTFVNTKQSDIAAGLLQHTQGQPGGNLGIVYVPGFPTDVRRDRAYAIGDNLGDRLAELGRVEGGFDWWIDARPQLQLAMPRGTATDDVLDYGSTVTAVTREPDVAGFANTVLVTGAQGLTPAVRIGSGVLADVRGRWEDTFSYPSVTDQATVNAKANRLLTEGSKPPVTYTLTLAPGAWPTTVGAGLGDTAIVNVQSGQLREQVRARIEEVTVTIGDSGEETVTMMATATDQPLALVRDDRPLVLETGAQP